MTWLSMLVRFWSHITSCQNNKDIEELSGLVEKLYNPVIDGKIKFMKIKLEIANDAVKEINTTLDEIENEILLSYQNLRIYQSLKNKQNDSTIL